MTDPVTDDERLRLEKRVVEIVEQFRIARYELTAKATANDKELAHLRYKIRTLEAAAEDHGVSQCSCGGWLGTPACFSAQTSGSELPLLDVQAKLDDLDAKVEHLIHLMEAA